MKMTPFVSVFIPTYNDEIHVRQAIESVLAQTYRNYELLVINDASTDQTAQVIDQYQNHPAVRVYHNKINLGVAGNWNHGLSLCRGDYIVRLNADDYFGPDYLTKVMALVEEYPATDMIFTGTYLLLDNDIISEELPYPETWVRPGVAFLPELLRSCPIRASSVCVRHSCLTQLGGVINEMDIHEDWELWTRISANGQVGYIAEALTYYRVLNPHGCTSTAIINGLSPIACDIWLNRLTSGTLPYQLDKEELTLLKQGMYDLIMAFAVFALESGSTGAVQKHLAYAKKLLPPNSKGSMQARLFTRAAEIYFMNGGQHFKGWQFLLRSLKYGPPPQENHKHLKLWARAFFGKKLFEFVRTHTVARHKFPRVEVDLN